MTSRLERLLWGGISPGRRVPLLPRLPGPCLLDTRLPGAWLWTLVRCSTSRVRQLEVQAAGLACLHTSAAGGDPPPSAPASAALPAARLLRAGCALSSRCLARPPGAPRSQLPAPRAAEALAEEKGLWACCEPPHTLPPPSSPLPAFHTPPTLHSLKIRLVYFGLENVDDGMEVF